MESNNFECKCDKSFNVGEYLDYENCKCIKRLTDKLVDECTVTIEEVKLAKITLAENKNSYKCSSCRVYIVLMIVFFAFFTGTTTYFVYYNWLWLKIMFLALSLVFAKKQRFGKHINWRDKTNKY